jgi:iron complex transport system substrate-binding protein
MPWSKILRTLYLAPLALAAMPAEAAPRRIVSLNLCTDQYLLALADRAQIAALTANARDTEMSAAAAKVGNIPMVSHSAEALVTIDPDLVLAGPGWRSGAMAAVPIRNRRIVELANADSYADIVAQIRQVATAIGHADRGEALVARMDRALAALPKAGRGRVAAYYQRRGYLTGTGTLVDDLMRRVGLVNLAGKLNKPVLSQMSLEELIAARPDFLIVESATDRITDQGTEMLHHPLLKDIPRLRLPQAWTVCGGPAYVLAAEGLVRQLATRR